VAYALVLSLAAGLLARVRRPARVLLTLAAVSTAAVVAIVVARQSVVPMTLVAGWVADRNFGWDRIDDHERSVWLVLIALPAFVFACGRFARWRCLPAHAWLATAALGLPPVLGFAALALLWRVHGEFTATDHEGWVTLVQATRGLLIATAVAVPVVAVRVLRDRPFPGAARMLLAAVVLALGVVAVVATQPHRHTIDDLYPLHDPGAESINFRDLTTPWLRDFPATTTCVPLTEPYYLHTKIVVHRNGAGLIRFRIVDGRNHTRDAALAALDAEHQRHSAWEQGMPRGLVLLVEREVPMTELAPFLTALPDRGIDRVYAVGLHRQDVPTADGPAIAWDHCAVGVLRPAALRRREYATGATWSSVIADPNLVARE